MSRTYVIEIENCAKCPNVDVAKYYTEDSWDDCRIYRCKDMDHRKIDICDWNEKIREIPDWCPLPNTME